MDPAINISPNFQFHELFSSRICTSYSESFLLKLLDRRLIEILEELRSDFGAPITVNNWYYGGNLQYRGFRPMSTSVGALYSQHKFGRAIDFSLEHLTPAEIHDHILQNRNARKFMELGLTRLESHAYTPTWVHFDLAFTGLDEIYVFNP